MRVQNEGADTAKRREGAANTAVGRAPLELPYHEAI